MRITTRYAQRVGALAEEFTGGAVREPQVGGDVGRGSRVISGNDSIVWLSAPRAAAAYYMGTMLGWARASGTQIPAETVEFCKPIRELVPASTQLQGEQAKGEDYGRAIWEARDRKPRAHRDNCTGCGEPIPEGRGGLVTVESRKHAITVNTHEAMECREAAHRKMMTGDTAWKSDPNYYAG